MIGKIYFRRPSQAKPHAHSVQLKILNIDGITYKRVDHYRLKYNSTITIYSVYNVFKSILIRVERQRKLFFLFNDQNVYFFYR